MRWPFRRPDISPQAPGGPLTSQKIEDVTHDEYGVLMRRLGRMEADVERLELSWTNHKDQLNRLVNRLEKREERAEKRSAESEEVQETPGVTALRERVLARRRH